MVAKVQMPQLGASMERGTIMKWFKKEGDRVTTGEPLVEIMTDKTNMEIEAEVSGVLLQICTNVDEEVAVHHVIAYIGEAGENVSDAPPKVATAEPIESHAVAQLQTTEPSGETAPFMGNTNKPRRTPAARQLAVSHGIDLRDVKGSGPNGRIHRVDVEKEIAGASPSLKATPLARKVAEEFGIRLSEVTGTGMQGKIVRDDVLGVTERVPVATEVQELEGEIVKLAGMRKVIAQRMVQSAFTAPHVTLTTEVDMLQAVELRNKLLPLIEKTTGERLSYTEIIMKAVAHALRKHPIMNASLQGEQIVLHHQVSIGLAVSVPNGLLVPVVRNADQQGLASLTKDCKRLGKLAREGKLTPDQMSGGTFTITNLGMYDVDVVTPIINQPESAILGVGRIRERAVGVNGAIQLRPMMTLSLSCDHRIIDGAPAAAFLTEVKELLENPYLVMV